MEIFREFESLPSQHIKGKVTYRKAFKLLTQRTEANKYTQTYGKK